MFYALDVANPRVASETCRDVNTQFCGLCLPVAPLASLSSRRKANHFLP